MNLWYRIPMNLWSDSDTSYRISIDIDIDFLYRKYRKFDKEIGIDLDDRSRLYRVILKSIPTLIFGISEMIVSNRYRPDLINHLFK